MFCLCFTFIFFIFNDYVRPVILIFAGPILTKFAGLLELRLWMKELKLFFSIPQVTLLWQPIFWAKSKPNLQNWVRVRFARPRRKQQEVQVLRWTQANQLTVINRRLWE